MCVHSSTPPLVFIGGATPRSQLFSAEPTLGASEGAPRGKVEAVGPMGLVGRRPSGPTDLPFRSIGSFLGPLVIGTGIGSCTVGFLLWWAIYSIF